jgi:predicted amidohydrolase YtcJ
MRRILRWTAGSGFAPCDPNPVVAALLRSEAAFRDAPCVLILPPLWDHHGHVAWYGALLEQADLRGCASVQEALECLKAASAVLPPDSWLEGFGWDQNLWGGAYPDRSQLDALFPDEPVFLTRIDGHAAWVNGEALRRAGVEDGVRDPPGGLFLRSGGRLTGILLDRAMETVRRAVPQRSREALRARLLRALESLRDLGLCGTSDMGTEPEALEVLRELDREGALPLPLDCYPHVPGPAAWCNPGEGERLAVVGGKLFADGALGSRGAALFEDYSDAPGERGLLLRETRELAHAIQSVAARGMVPAVHAIGDRALEQVLDALALCGNPPARIEHAQTVTDGQLGRLAASGATASVQPCHYLSDRAWLRSRLGDRAKGAYRCGSLKRAGIPLLLGTDFPIEPPDPWRNFLACATREEGEGIGVQEVLDGYAPPPGRAVPGSLTLVACEGPEALPEASGGGAARWRGWVPAQGETLLR